MVDGVLAWAGVDEQKPTSVLDVGCGIGGSTRHIVRKYGCTGQGSGRVVCRLDRP